MIHMHKGVFFFASFGSVCEDKVPNHKETKKKFPQFLVPSFFEDHRKKKKRETKI